MVFLKSKFALARGQIERTLLPCCFIIGIGGFLICSAEEAIGVDETVTVPENHYDESAALLEPEAASATEGEESSKSEVPSPEIEHEEPAEVAPPADLGAGESGANVSLPAELVSKKSFSRQLSPQQQPQSNYIMAGEPDSGMGAEAGSGEGWTALDSQDQKEGPGEEKSSPKRFDIAKRTGMAEEGKFLLLKRQIMLADRTKDYRTAEKLSQKLLDADIVDSERRQLILLLADRMKDYRMAEKLYLKLLNMDIEDSERRQLLLDMAGMYEKAGISSKTVVIYEKFIETFDRDPEVPAIFIKLGIIYREMGVTKMALLKFYNVLNSSLSIPQEEMGNYIQLSMKAQLEIAETYFLIGDYEEAAKFFSKLKILDLGQKDQESVHFKSAYSQYLLENYATVVAALDKFINNYPKSHLVAESHFLLANSYKRLNRPRDAVKETLNLLHKNLINRSKDESLWFYWKKRTGNQLANEFYEQSDFLSALKIYQAMAPLNKDPEWQWPII